MISTQPGCGSFRVQPRSSKPISIPISHGFRPGSRRAANGFDVEHTSAAASGADLLGAPAPGRLVIREWLPPLMPASDRDLRLAFIELFDGGVINSTNIALKVAKLAQESLGQGDGASPRLPISITDGGDSWSVPLSRWVGAEGGGVVRRLRRIRNDRFGPVERSDHMS